MDELKSPSRFRPPALVQRNGGVLGDGRTLHFTGEGNSGRVQTRADVSVTA